MSLLEPVSDGGGAATRAALIARSEQLARRALLRYDFSPEATVEVINLSENVTLRIDDPQLGERAVMRLHRPGYHTVAQIKSELQWLDALRQDRCVSVPPPIGGRHGERVITVDGEFGEPRHVTVCGWLDGHMPAEHGDLERQFSMLGATTARLHRHALGWARPPGFVRRPWNAEQLLGERPTFGAWREGIGLGVGERAMLERAERHVLADLRAFGTGADVFGLVHADLRLANLLVDEAAGQVRVIDFDDCGHGWLMYDFGTAVSFFEHSPQLDRLAAAWCDGYRTERPLSAALQGQLATFVMLRRLVLVGWVARSHETATEAAALGAEFTAGACDVAERYLGGRLT